MPGGEWHPRFLAARIMEALRDTRIVLLQGARQVGKSTLASQIAQDRGGLVVSLDDPGVLRYARDDPAGFVDQAGGHLLVIDEAQRAPELVLALKVAVDRDRRPGRYMVTGSADLTHVGPTHESLVGRVETLVLEPLSQGELAGRGERFIDRVFADEPVRLLRHSGSLSRSGYVEAALAGGYPEAVARGDSQRRAAWYQSYIRQIVNRDAPDVSGLERLHDLPRLVRLIAARSGSPMVWTSLAEDAGLARRTLTPYVDLLEGLYLVRTLRAWTGSHSGREAKAPKVFLTDPGLMMATLGLDARAASPLSTRDVAGPLMETFVVNELHRQAAWNQPQVTFYHYRESGRAEVDVVAESHDGRVVGIKIKAAESVQARDVRSLARLRDAIGDRFAVGVVLYTGRDAVRLGDRVVALPIDALWH
ncbi:MAG: ATP-binding protein [Bifidobacteriaceae bacterium]|jgi:predicted AAA+ superfamily ATPase|nr:ATP-binding protein [Bifidobacteriaceae bacterium]